MIARIQLRNDTASAWTMANPILAQGEMGIESDTLKQKIGDGTTAWNALGYSAQPTTDAGLQTLEKTVTFLYFLLLQLFLLLAVIKALYRLY